MAVFRAILRRRRLLYVCALAALSLPIASLALGFAAGAQSLTATMAIARAGHTATLLPDGRVLVTGGSPYITTSEIYDPAQNEWTSVGNMSMSRVGHTATLLRSEERRVGKEWRSAWLA